jgi:hypothetical protein
MADFYPYLVSSLPMLHFDMKPPFSFDRFLEMCCPLIPEKDCQLLRAVPQPGQYLEKGTRPPVVQRWVDFDVALRNELVKIRAAKKHLDPTAYLRPGGSDTSSIAMAVLAGNTTASPLDAEKALDESRWKALENIATGHYFDLDFLITYACKLLILERWEKIQSADGSILLEQVLQL